MKLLFTMFMPIFFSGFLFSQTVQPGAVVDLNRFTGSYTGDGTTAQAITGIGFSPIYVKIWVKGTNHNQSLRYWEATPQIIDDHIEGYSILTSTNVTGQTNKIISLDLDGFTVDDNGTNKNPNKLNKVYNYIAER